MENKILGQTVSDVDPKCLIICQGREKNIEKLISNTDLREIKFLAGVWDNHQTSHVNLVGTTWGEGRNQLFEIANESYPDLDWLWIDDDTVFENGSIETFIQASKCQSINRKCVCVPRTEKILNWKLFTKSKKACEETVFFDEQVMFFPQGTWRKEVLWHETKYQDISWFTVAELHENQLLINGVDIIQLNDFTVANLNHADSNDELSLYQRAQYKVIHKSLYDHFKFNPVHWSRVNFKVKNYPLSRLLFKIIWIYHSLVQKYLK